MYQGLTCDALGSALSQSAPHVALARLFDVALRGSARDNLTAVVTPGYAAPETLEGQPLATSADLYGVACVIYELAGGKHPFRRLPSTQARDERLERDLRAPAHLPKHCWPALRSALAFEAVERTTATQLRDALGATSTLRQRLRFWT